MEQTYQFKLEKSIVDLTPIDLHRTLKKLVELIIYL